MINITIPSHLCYCYAGNYYLDGAGQHTADWKFFITLDGSREEHDDSYFKERKNNIRENDVSHGSANGDLSISGGSYYTPDGRDTHGRLGVHDAEFFDTMIVNGFNGTYVASSFRTGSMIYYGWWRTIKKRSGKKEYWTFVKQGVPGCIILDETFYFEANQIKVAYAAPVAGSYQTQFDTEEECIEMLLSLPCRMSITSTPRVQKKILFCLGSEDVSWTVSRLPKVVTRFAFNEPAHIFNGRGWHRSEVVETCRQNAFWNAADGIRVLNDNLVATLLEAIQFLLALKQGKVSIKECIPQSLTDLWLQYRYKYNTTKMDLEEGIAFIKWTRLFDVDQDFKTHGKYFDEEHGVSCYCTLTVRSKMLSGLLKAWTALRTYGLQPNFYLIWDSLPFSFIVDWFIPVGDLMEIIDKQNYLTDTFTCVSCVYSLKYDDKLRLSCGEITYHMYSRWLERHFPALEFQYLYDGGSPSDKTIVFRCLDAVSLILGRKRG